MHTEKKKTARQERHADYEDVYQSELTQKVDHGQAILQSTPHRLPDEFEIEQDVDGVQYQVQNTSDRGEMQQQMFTSMEEGLQYRTED